MRSVIRFPVVLSCLVILLIASSAAQQIRFETFAPSPTASQLVFNGNSRLAIWNSQVVLRLTDGAESPETSTAYFTVPQPLNQGFTTYFKFQIHNPTQCCSPGSGLAFIIQNSDATNQSMGATGSGVHALGAGGGALGYSGINHSMAVEFDIQQDPWDPNSNHIAFQSCGSDFNTPVHLPGVYTIGDDNNVTSCLVNNSINTNIPMLGGTCSEDGCSDGNPHEVVIEYTAPQERRQQQGLLQVYLDPQFIPGTHTPVEGSPTVLSTNFDATSIGLNGSSALAGFTGSQPSDGTTQDILAWEFTNHGPAQITQVIQSGGTQTTFAFGNHQALVTYPMDFQNDQNISMTVLATPTNQADFHTQRLQGTQFANENCVIYLGTGGNCLVYSVTCQDSNGNQVTCPQRVEQDDIAICSQFKIANTNSVNNPDFLEADPIGSNNWTSIFTEYDPSDPVVSGRGRGFSDLVATFIMGPVPHRGFEVPRRKSLDKLIREPGRLPPRLRPGSSQTCPPVD